MTDRARPRAALFALCGAIAFALGAGAAPPHVHGVATLDVALDGVTLQMTLESPLDNLVGFEHAPANAREMQAIRDMQQKLSKPEALFALSPQARCTVKSVELKDHHDEGHAELHADIAFRCEHPRELKRIEVKLFSAFPGMHRIDAQVATPRKQSAATLTAKANVIAL